MLDYHRAIPCNKAPPLRTGTNDQNDQHLVLAYKSLQIICTQSYHCISKLLSKADRCRAIMAIPACCHCHKPTFWGFMCDCEREHGTPGDWFWICEDNSQCRLCPHCLQPADDILTCSSICDEVSAATTSTWHTDGSDQAVCVQALVPSGMRAK